MEEYLSAEDKALLIEFAGPIFAEAKNIDANSVDKDGYRTSRHAQEIQMALERDFQTKSAPRHFAPPPNPYLQQQPASVVDYGQYLQPPIHYPPVQVMQPVVDTGQMEFQFDQSEQQKTNSLLEEVSRKLTKVVALLEKLTQPTENVTKLKITKDPVQKVSGFIGKDQ